MFDPPSGVFRFRYFIPATLILALLVLGWILLQGRMWNQTPTDRAVKKQETPPPPPASALVPSAPPEPMVLDLGGNRYSVGAITFDKKSRTISIPASVNMREGAVEYLLVGRNGKVHEAVFTTDADARDIHVAALLLGIKPSGDLGPENAAATVRRGGAVVAWAEWDRNGPPAKIFLNETVNLSDPSSGTTVDTLPASAWLYNGSRIEPDGAFAASRGGSIISIIRDDDALINNPGASRDNDEIHTPNALKLPKQGHPVRIVFQVK